MYAILLVSILLSSVSARWFYSFENKCAIDDEGQRRFYTDEGYRLCTEKTCPKNKESIFTPKSCCQRCCYDLVTPSDKDENTGSTNTSGARIENIVSKISYALNILALMIIICIGCFYLRRRDINRTIHKNPCTEKENSLLSATDINYTSEFEKSNRLQNAKLQESLVTTDSTRTITGKRFETAVVDRFTLPPAYSPSVPTAPTS